MTLPEHLSDNQPVKAYEKMLKVIDIAVGNYIKYANDYPVNMQIEVLTNRESSFVRLRATKDEYEGSVVLAKDRITEARVKQALKGLKLEYYRKIGELR